MLLGLLASVLATGLTADAPPLPAPPAAAARASASATHPTHTKLAMLELESGLGADPKLAHLITTLVTTELRKQPDIQVTSQQEIQTLLGFEKQRQLLSCAQTNCIAEIGGALGVDNIVTGSVAQLGESLLVVLRLVEVRKARVVREVSRRLKDAKADAVVDIIPGLVAELLGQAEAQTAPPPPGPPPTVAAVPPAAVTPPPEVQAQHTRSNGPYWLMGIGAAVLVAGLVVTGVEFATAQGPKTNGALNQYAVTEAAASTSNTLAYVGDAAAGVGGAVAVAGLGWFFLQPKANAE